MAASGASFVGRARELAALEESHGGKDSAIVAIYGRRRVGKSELILRFIRGRPAVWHTLAELYREG